MRRGENGEKRCASVCDYVTENKNAIPYNTIKKNKYQFHIRKGEERCLY